MQFIIIFSNVIKTNGECRDFSKMTSVILYNIHTDGVTYAGYEGQEGLTPVK